MLSMFARPEDQPQARTAKAMPPKAQSAGAHRPALAAAANPPRPAPTKPAPSPIRLLDPATANTNRAAKNVLERHTPNIGQYLHHLQHDLKSYVRAETVNAVIGATPAEIQRVARILAKLKGRYLAQLVDLGNGTHAPIGEAEIRDLRRTREMYEEVELGLTRLREAIEAGDLELDGVKGDL